MPHARPSHHCRLCGVTAQRWVGRCPACGEWNSLEEVPPSSGGATAGAAPEPLAGVGLPGARPAPTGLVEVDRVLGGGLHAGSVTLVFGEPGVGKSTLLLQVLMSAATAGRRVLLVCAEESAPQVRARAERLGPLPPSLLVVATSEVASVEAAVAAERPELVVVDSVQTVGEPGVPGAPGTVTQVRACVDRLSRMARHTGAAVVLVGHVTKDGDLAGPRVLEHLVDTVVSFEGDRHHALRLLRALKHRFAPTGEIGLFEMGAAGLAGVADPGPLLLGDRRPDVPGSAVAALLGGRRPLLVELQSLACEGRPGSAPAAQGVDGRRLAFLLAVLECRAGVALGGAQVFVSATGGVQATEPAADLPLALAVASAAAGTALPADLVAFGEIGLAGEVRGVPGPERRLSEAWRLGFARALVPASAPAGPEGMAVVHVRSVADALQAVRRMVGAPPRSPPATPARAGGEAADPGRPALPAGTMRSWSSTAVSR